MPVGITVEFAGGNPTDANIRIPALPDGRFLAPSQPDFGGELGDVFVILKICPKLDPSPGFFSYNFTNYGDGWSDMTPRAAPDY